MVILDGVGVGSGVAVAVGSITGAAVGSGISVGIIIGVKVGAIVGVGAAGNIKPHADNERTTNEIATDKRYFFMVTPEFNYTICTQFYQRGAMVNNPIFHYDKEKEQQKMEMVIFKNLLNRRS